MTKNLALSILTVALLACTNTKKSQSTSKADAKAKSLEEPAINLDTIRVCLLYTSNGKHAPFGLNNSFKGAVQEQVLKWIREK